VPSWYLDHPADIAAQARYTFRLPTPEALARVAPGQTVTLLFRFDPSESADPEASGVERLPVRVAASTGDGSFVGRLDAPPAFIEDLRQGDPVLFRPSHILQTEHDHLDDRLARFLPRCFVTKRVLMEGARIGCLYREEPMEEIDSGWRLMAGDESAGYLDSTGNTLYLSLGSVLNHDDSFLHLLEAPVGSAFRRATPEEEFVPVPQGG